MADPVASTEWVCGYRLPRTSAKGLADPALAWDRRELSVGFLQGSPQLQDRVLKTAQRWTLEGDGPANLRFTKAREPRSADIRLSFDKADGSWSVIGTDALRVAKGQPTMNLGWVAANTREKDFASVVLHEFGHAIALLHEHNHPRLKLDWNKPAVYADLMGSPNNWSSDDVDYNVFESYPEDRVALSENPDLVSIMIYTIPSHWLNGQPGITPSDHLSEGDKEFVATLYP